MFRTFHSLRIRNFRLWFFGLMVSGTGTAMQATAQDWVVLTKLTNHNAAAVGTVIALQLGPQLVLLPFTGAVSDRFSPRRVLLVSQVFACTLSLCLGVLVLTDTAQLWEVLVFAFLLGCGAGFDGPARQVFIMQVVPQERLANGIALNAAAFNVTRLLGPAAAGLLIAAVGSGWAFVANSLSFLAMIGALLAMSPADLRVEMRPRHDERGFWRGVRYLRGERESVLIMFVAFLVGLFGLNVAIVTATMASLEFGTGAAGFGLLTSTLACGSILGALAAAARGRPTLAMLGVSALLFSVLVAVAAVMPSYFAFAAALPLVGFTMMLVMNTANARVQIETAPAFRGRVIGIFMSVSVAAGPIGGPLVGALSNEFGPRVATILTAVPGGVGGLLVLIVVIRRAVIRKHAAGASGATAAASVRTEKAPDRG